MFTAFYSYYKSYKQKSELAKKRDLKQFEIWLEKLMENDSDEEQDKDEPTQNDTIAELSWGCTKNTGIVTALDKKGGIINHKYTFPKEKALDFWSVIKVGSELTFLLYNNSVSSMKLIDTGWENDINDNIELPKNEIKAKYKTDVRTCVGMVERVANNTIFVSVGNTRQMISADLSEYQFMKGDNLSLTCIVTEDEASWNPADGMFGSILEVSSFKPNGVVIEIGEVTGIFEKFVRFNETIVCFKSTLTEENVKPGDQFEYKAIETTFSFEEQNYNWRVVEIIKKSLQEKALFDTSLRVQLEDVHFSIAQNKLNVTRTVSIVNNSSERLSVIKCDITSNHGFIKLQNPDKKITLRSYNGVFNIFVTLSPTQYGIFVEELTVDFGSFTKKCSITLQVKEKEEFQSSRSQSAIPGQKISKGPRFLYKRMDSYDIPHNFRKKFDFKKQHQLLLNDFLTQKYDFLLQPLTETNYLAKMRHCLYLEEIEAEINFERYKIDRAHFENKDEFLKLQIEGVNEKRPSITIGDTIHAINPDPKKSSSPPWAGVIHRVEQNAILVKFNPDFHSSHNQKDFKVEFFFSRSLFKRQHFALDSIISPNSLGMDFLFPKIKGPKKNLQVDVSLSTNEKMILNGEERSFFNDNLNIYQKKAVVNILRGECRPLPYIIYGPPGTGKTSTVMECIEQISDKISWARIIIATPSNSAANLIVEKLIASGRYKGGDFIRFVSYNQIEKGAIPSYLKKYCATIDIGYDSGNAFNFKRAESGLMMNCSKSIIIKYKIYISTLSNLGQLMSITFMRDHFTHVIIDEAGQSVETESIIPMTFLSHTKGQVILAGDPKQLGPVLISQAAKNCQFDQSLLERLSKHEYYLPKYGPKNNDFDERFVTKLKKNYRALPSILKIYSHLFYDNDLEAEISETDSNEMKILQSIDSILWNRQKADKQCGVYFVNVNGSNKRSFESSSWYNNEEASRLFLFVCKLKKLGISMSDVGVITPYSLQVRNLKNIFRESMPECDIKVGSVEEFQGQERNIILVSTVRTSRNLLNIDQKFNLGFLQCSKRMNVAISRARTLLVVFGKESLLSQDENWRYLIKFTKDKGTFVFEN